MTEPEFSIVIPCYNEDQGIKQTISGIRDTLKQPNRCEILVVDDGSTDRSLEILGEIAANNGDPAVRIIHHEQNRGYGASIKTGIRNAQSEIIVIIDADGTYPADKIGEMAEMVRGSVDMVIGSRTGEQITYPFLRRIPKVFLNAYVSWLTGRSVPDMNSGMRAFRRPLLLPFMRILPDGFSFTTTSTIAALCRKRYVEFLPINYNERLGKSKIRPIADTLNFIQLVVRTGMYFAPLRALAPIVCVLAFGFLASLGYDVFVLENLTDKTVLILMFTLNTLLFALLADMIDKRTNA